MEKVQIKCLCGHVNHYEKEITTKVFECVDDAAVKRFSKLSYDSFLGGYHLLVCPICGTVKATRAAI